MFVVCFDRTVTKLDLPETFWIMTRRLFGFPSAESCGFKSPKKPFQIVIDLLWVKIPLFYASYVASSQLSTLGSQIIVDLARGDLVLNRRPASIVRIDFRQHRIDFMVDLPV